LLRIIVLTVTDGFSGEQLETPHCAACCDRPVITTAEQLDVQLSLLMVVSLLLDFMCALRAVSFCLCHCVVVAGFAAARLSGR
jgi:hypothetical protein